MSQIVISLRGGLIQDIFCNDVDVTVVDWDTEGSSLADHGIFEVLIACEDESGPRRALAYIGELPAHPPSELAGTDVEAALTAAGVKVHNKPSGLLQACEAAHAEIEGLLNRGDTRDLDLKRLWPVLDQLTREINQMKGGVS